VPLVSDLPADASLITEEQFGPALPIINYADLDETIATANASENGLGASLWSKDIEAARRIALRLECGSDWINKHGAVQPNAPFRGVKRSGLGVEFGEEGLIKNTDIQVVFS
jgi:acyl-CoA reductase-like NAD-dependent aldehyde dehydrogenase